MEYKAISKENIIFIFKSVSVDMRKHIEELRNMDAILGDGDLGITTELACKAILDFFDSISIEEKSIGDLLIKCGFKINKSSPSTFGTLLAFGFIGAGKAVKEKKELLIEDLLSMGEGAVDNIKAKGGAEIGEKTMLDSLIPAVNSFKKAIDSKLEYKEALLSIIDAAEAGAKATKDMKAKHSRASWREESSIGVQDGGATAVYLFIKYFINRLIDIIKL